MDLQFILANYNNTLFVQQLKSELDPKIMEFTNIMERLDLFRANCSERAFDAPRQDRNISEFYEITIRNLGHPRHHVESYGFVDATNSNDWFLTQSEIEILSAYGFEIDWKFVDMK